MAERVEAMKAIWTQDEASYDGEHVDFDRIWSWPKPAQRPHPPVLVGGNGPTVLDRVLAFGDGWFPFPYDGLLDQVAELRRRAAEQGRTVTVVVGGRSHAIPGRSSSTSRRGSTVCCSRSPPPAAGPWSRRSTRRRQRWRRPSGRR